MATLESGQIANLKVRCLNADENAWRELYRFGFRKARAVAIAPPFLCDAATADDIAQEVILVLTKNLATIENVGGFIGRVAHNTCVDRIRKKREVPLTSLSVDDSTTDRILANLPAAEYLPEEIDDNKALAALGLALDSLGTPCRQLLRARFFDELSYAESAVRVSLPVTQVGVYLGRCLNRLKTLMERQGSLWEELRRLVYAGHT